MVLHSYLFCVDMEMEADFGKGFFTVYSPGPGMEDGLLDLVMAEIMFRITLSSRFEGGCRCRLE